MARALLVSGIHSQEFVADESEQMESDFYLQARQEWDERYYDLVLGKRNWQLASSRELEDGTLRVPGYNYLQRGSSDKFSQS